MKITIPQPCHENWDTMTPDEQGKFCSVCSKTVRDFTAASDEDLAEAFSGISETACGHFKASQLNRDLQYSHINSLFAKFAVGFAVTAGGIIPIHAQQHEPQEKIIRQSKVTGKVMPGLIKKDTADTRNLVLGGIHRVSLDTYRPLYVINGKMGTESDFKALDPKSIKALEVLKGTSATDLYGEKAKNGVIVVTVKRKRK
ncbi:TonB-dependent receptor plug domain-containing protein [Chryseobacterium sp. JJR-5R]|uniref:TonB-dependent receptor plug domain-containing protein n=1 Tax=Chryseobacterium sp. JJR-5R TaxID=3093923 RepID=UPI002A752342|nr:TonB-dependent receptor plug domain-containing protein [Chryseobacterium sp. JJR-5R]WPO84234.1 TonB-dependent receptor plug domain-containing protein [Chryseobacterium sp. JJR-5R]